MTSPTTFEITSTVVITYYHREVCGIDSPGKFLQPDPDIAGIGIMISLVFIGSVVMILTGAFVLMNCGWLHRYLFWFIQRFRAPNKQSRAEIKYHTLENDDDRSRGSLLSTVALAVGDTQTVTGIAIFIASQVKNDISQYHYIICEQMTWLANGTSTVALDATNRGAIKHVSSTTASRVVRVMLSVTLFIGALVIGFRRDDSLWYIDMATRDTFWWNMEDPVVRYDVFQLIVNTAQTIMNIVSLWPEFAERFYEGCENTLKGKSGFPYPLTNLLGKPEATTSKKGYLSSVPTTRIQWIIQITASALWVTLWIPMALFYFIAFSHIGSYLFNISSFVWGVNLLYKWRREAKGCMLPEGMIQEDAWSFGQIVPMVLLLSPFIVSADIWAATCLQLMKRFEGRRILTSISRTTIETFQSDK